MEHKFLITDTNRAGLIAAVTRAIQLAPPDYVVTIAAPPQTVSQQRKYHAMFRDIADQVEIFGVHLSPFEWKRTLAEQFVQDMREQAQGEGKADPFPQVGRFLPSLDGRRFVPIYVATSDFNRAQAAAFIEFLMAFGVNHQVAWRGE